MAEQDGLENRLKQLQEVLDERVTLLTKPPKRSRGKARHESTNQVPQRSQQSSQAAYGPSIAYQGTSPGTPGRPMPDRTPADGTSARETQAAVEFFKNGDFHVGRPLKEDVAFCPWHAVTSYPGRFIGKANRPRVSSLHKAASELLADDGRRECTSTRFTKGESGTCEQ